MFIRVHLLSMKYSLHISWFELIIGYKSVKFHYRQYFMKDIFN